MMTRRELAKKLIIEEGQSILAGFGKRLRKTEKEKHDFVSTLDVRIEKEFTKRIRKVFPHDAIYAEEEGFLEGGSEYMWVIDPLDGTNNFLRGIPHAGIQLGIFHNNLIYEAMIFNPFTFELFFASRGKGAFATDFRTRKTQSLKVSRRSLPESMLIFDSGIVRGEGRAKRIFDALLGKIAFLRIYGVAVLDLPYVASGRADILISNIPKPMDVAPGALLVEEAGGKVVDFYGRPWHLEMKNLLVANKRNFSQALALIKKAYGRHTAP